jgi:predicted DNA-binding protein YlxM (UPF0122 family)
MKIEDNLKVIKLIDTYGVLLTSRQYEIVSSYYFENLSLSEIGENCGISRQAVSDSLNQSIRILEQYEENLKSIEKSDTIISELTTISKGISDLDVVDKLNRLIDYIRG